MLSLVPHGAAARPQAPQPPCVTNPPEVVARQPPPEVEPPPDLASKLDIAAQESFNLSGAPGAIAGVATPQGVWTKAYGFADPAARQPMATDMHMRIGSVTKTFTGTVILQLAQEGRLSLDDPIDKYYKGIPNGDKTTLKELVNMTSGIASYYTDAFLQRYYGDPTGTFTPDELIAYGVSASPIFEPGDMFYSSNTNSILLGKVIEAVTGGSVQTAFQQRIYGPLDLAGTSLPDASADLPSPHPQGYTLQNAKTAGEPVDATNWNPSFGWTAGAMISTLADMLTYTRALGTGQGLLSAQGQIQRLESFQASSGHGLALYCSGGWVGHTGELPGFSSNAFYDTTTDTTVVVMLNSDIPSGNCGESPRPTDNPARVACSSAASRIFTGLSEALGHRYDPPPNR
jgi:D-alanyl-D-alanine carboxypeptidase